MALLPHNYICRVGYCPKCYKENSPHTGDVAWVVGSRGFKLIECDHIPRWYGFTPHLYQNMKVIGENVKYRSVCCMIGCSLYIQDKTVFIPSNAWKDGLMYLSDWNSLVMYRRDDNYKLDTF